MDISTKEEFSSVLRDKELFVKQSLEYARDLNKIIRELQDAHKEIEESYLDTIHRLALTAEYRDRDTGIHIKRMARYSSLLAKKAGFSNAEADIIFHAAPMHDIGKIGIPDKILQKPGKLSEDEFEIIKTHPLIGEKILSNSKSSILKTAQIIAKCHHEQWNGNGYPCGISGDEIPIEGRIVSIADVFDSLTSERHYKKAFDVVESLVIIMEGRGRHFDPELVDVFIDNFEEIHAIFKSTDNYNNSLEIK